MKESGKPAPGRPTAIPKETARIYQRRQMLNLGTSSGNHGSSVADCSEENPGNAGQLREGPRPPRPALAVLLQPSPGPVPRCPTLAPDSANHDLRPPSLPNEGDQGLLRRRAERGAHGGCGGLLRRRAARCISGRVISPRHCGNRGLRARRTQDPRSLQTVSG